jgi:hypothetical protein
MTRRPLLPLLALLAGACAHTERYVPPIPTVPLSFETNLTTGVECQYLGQVVGRDAVIDAHRREANLIVAFVINTSTSSYNGAQVTASTLMGTAVKCPPATLERLLAARATRPQP